MCRRPPGYFPHPNASHFSLSRSMEMLGPPRVWRQATDRCTTRSPLGISIARRALPVSTQSCFRSNTKAVDVRAPRHTGLFPASRGGLSGRADVLLRFGEWAVGARRLSIPDPHGRDEIRSFRSNVVIGFSRLRAICGALLLVGPPSLGRNFDPSRQYRRSRGISLTFLIAADLASSEPMFIRRQARTPIPGRHRRRRNADVP